MLLRGVVRGTLMFAGMSDVAGGHSHVEGYRRHLFFGKG